MGLLPQGCVGDVAHYAGGARNGPDGCDAPGRRGDELQKWAIGGCRVSLISELFALISELGQQPPDSLAPSQIERSRKQRAHPTGHRQQMEQGEIKQLAVSPR